MNLEKRSYNNWICWQCNQQRTAGCMGQLATEDTSEDPRSHVNDNHPADRTGVEATKLRTIKKAMTKKSRSRPNQSLTRVLLEISDEVRANIGRSSHASEGFSISAVDVHLTIQQLSQSYSSLVNERPL